VRLVLPFFHLRPFTDPYHYRNPDRIELGLTLFLSSSAALLVVLLPLGGLTLACLRGTRSTTVLSDFAWHLLSPVSAACVLYTLAEDCPHPSRLETKDDPASWIGGRSLVVSGRSVVDPPPPTLEVACTLLEPFESKNSLDKAGSGQEGLSQREHLEVVLDESALNSCTPTHLRPSGSREPLVSFFFAF